MIIKTNEKDRAIEFSPEGDVDAYYLGSVFFNSNHSLSIKLNTKDSSTKMVLKVGMGEIWRMLSADKIKKGGE